MNRPLYRFGVYQLDVARRELRKHGQPVALSTSAIDLIAYLVMHADRAVGRDELIAAVWGRTDVTDTVLGQTMLKARRALGDDGRQQFLIQTVPRFGYRWVGALSTGEPLPAATAAAVLEVSALPPLQPAAPPEEPPALLDSRPSPAPTRARILLWPGLATAALFALVFALVSILPSPHAAGATEPLPRNAAAVLPAQVDAEASWQWLRLGAMDLVADRLRQGGIATLPSETVVAALAHDAPGESAFERSALQVFRLHLVQSPPAWKAVIELPPDRVLRIEAEHADPIAALRRATDMLLVRLGREPPPAESGELEETLHRSRAAMLSDQFELARRLLDNASPSIRERPELRHRRAQLALRAGDYRAVDDLVTPLLGSGTLDASIQARLLITLAAAELRRQRADSALRRYGEAAALLEHRGDPATRGTALLGVGSALALKGTLDEAALALGRARSELLAANDALGVAQADLNLAQVARLRERPGDAIPMLQSARQRFLAWGAFEEAAFAALSSTEAHLEMLDPAGASASLDPLWPPEKKIANARMRWSAILLRARVLAQSGRLIEADALLERVHRDSDPELDRVVRARSEFFRLQLAASAGDLERTERLAAAIAETPESAGLDRCAYVRAQADRLQLLLRTPPPAGLRAEAAELRRQFAPWRAEACIRLPLDLLEAAAMDGPWEQRRATYRDLLADAERVGIPDYLVQAGGAYAEAALGAGDLEAADAAAGRISGWAEGDFMAALIQVRVHRAQGRALAMQQAEAQLRRLSGDRPVQPAGPALPPAAPP
jgi:DNA-binding winged helix-turn-helix (wHTH) protein